MSIEERKIEIRKQLKKYENNLKYARVTNLTYSKEEWLIDRLAASEDKVKQLSEENTELKKRLEVASAYLLNNKE
jgi:cell shape-determining protein MreC